MAQAQVQTKPTFGYWNIRGGPRGNVNRYILHYVEVDYNDRRYDITNNPQEWGAQDKTTLRLDFPNLPYIFDGDFSMTESKAITHYICDKWAPQLLGTTPEQRARVIMLYHFITDHFLAIVMMAF